MSRNNLIIAGVAVVALIILFFVFSGAEETTAPVTETETPETEATE